MSQVFIFIASIVVAYFVGAFPTSFLLARSLKRIDIRQVGSKNAGATNVFRAVGKIPAFITLIVDVLKGLLVVTVVANFFYSFEQNLDYDFYRVFLGLAAVCGHIWPAFLKFKGGKGVATTLGVALGIAPLILLPSFAIWLVIFSIWNYVSLASIVSLISFPIIASIFRYPFYTILFSVLICSIVIFKHKENIHRLLKSEENKLRFKKV